LQPWLSPKAIARQQANADAFAALQRGDGTAALASLGDHVKFAVLPFSYLRGRAHLLTKDYASAETDLQEAIRSSRNIANNASITGKLPVIEMLSHFYLGQVYEQGGKRDQALNEYQNFLSHFPDEKTPLPQIGEARAALKRLMQ
ncbi:MAG TPA: tetratricopeptide repeat protein, partial [Terriglobales bacterium]